MRGAAAPVAALALALAGCQRHAPEGTLAGGGEVLPGSASDSMIAYDTLRSQPPLARASAPALARSPLDDEAPAPAEEASAEPPASSAPKEPVASAPAAD